MLKTRSLRLVQLVILLLTIGPQAYAGPDVGDSAPGFTINRLDGSQFDLSTYRGEKLVHLVFWATWCPVCRAEIPAIKNLQENHGDVVEVLAVSVNGSARPIPEYVERHQLNYPVAFDISRSVLERYNVAGTPTQILIDKSGMIVYRGSETPDMSNHLPVLGAE